VPETLTLESALTLAAERSPVLRARRQEVEEARGRLATARAFPFNPELELTVADRSSPGASTTDRGLGVSQELELAGQRRLRGAAAGRELAAVEAQLLRERRLLAARVAWTFAEALRARDLLAIEELDTELTRSFLELTETRLGAGAATQLDVNLARAAAGRALLARELAAAADLTARAQLAEEVGLEPSPLPEIRGGFPDAAGEPPPLAELLAAAAARRADLAALRQLSQARRERVELARKKKLPNLRLGAFVEREEGTDDILGAAFSLTLPVLNRHRGAVLEAEAASRRAEHEIEALRRSVAAQVVAAHADLTAAATAAEQLRTRVMGSLEESLDLLRRSFQAGKIGSTELLLFRRELVESRREHVETLARLRSARITLDLAAGRLPAVAAESAGTAEFAEAESTGSGTGGAP
jgi:cobalt-zinc-cadmium efflux system outer membrane protein